MSCFQCDCDIPHVCYHGVSNAQWGLNDSAIDALEAAQRYLRGLPQKKVAPVKDATLTPAPPFALPAGWTCEWLPRSTDHLLISTSAPINMVTVDLKARGFRPGYSTSSMFVGAVWNKKRKKYGGRGWRQAIVNDAVAHLKELLT